MEEEPKDSTEIIVNQPPEKPADLARIIAPDSSSGDLTAESLTGEMKSFWESHSDVAQGRAQKPQTVAGRPVNASLATTMQVTETNKALKK
ncbi:hypothetical protein HYW54_01865 [Candidatus Gottesmanbacteria bacterium]|nr:hypothetical protein [Candidatus Gottesmanbacteria bacterium]